MVNQINKFEISIELFLATARDDIKKTAPVKGFQMVGDTFDSSCVKGKFISLLDIPKSASLTTPTEGLSPN
jgi:hypothetical protein